jgi:hypothetical protein
MNLSAMKNIQWSLLLLLLFPACSSTKISSTWKAEDAGPKSYSKILVLGLIREADRGLQENMEDHLVGDLCGLGYNAVSAFKEYGPKGFEKMDEQAALGKLLNSGIDAVITIVLLDNERERRYVPSQNIYSPYGYYQSHFWDYCGTMYHRIYEAGYFVTNTRYFWESNLYDMSDQHLVYSVQTQSFDPANSGSLGHEYGRLIVKNMVKNNVLIKNAAYLPEKAF